MVANVKSVTFNSLSEAFIEGLRNRGFELRRTIEKIQSIFKRHSEAEREYKQQITVCQSALDRLSSIKKKLKHKVKKPEKLEAKISAEMREAESTDKALAVVLDYFADKHGFEAEEKEHLKSKGGMLSFLSCQMTEGKSKALKKLPKKWRSEFLKDPIVLKDKLTNVLQLSRARVKSLKKEKRTLDAKIKVLISEGKKQRKKLEKQDRELEKKRQISHQNIKELRSEVVQLAKEILGEDEKIIETVGDNYEALASSIRNMEIPQRRVESEDAEEVDEIAEALGINADGSIDISEAHVHEERQIGCVESVKLFFQWLGFWLMSAIRSMLYRFGI